MMLIRLWGGIGGRNAHRVADPAPPGFVDFAPRPTTYSLMSLEEPETRPPPNAKFDPAAVAWRSLLGAANAGPAEPGCGPMLIFRQNCARRQHQAAIFVRSGDFRISPLFGQLSVRDHQNYGAVIHGAGIHRAILEGLRSSIAARRSDTLVIAMHPTTDESAQTAAMDFARRIVPFWQAELGSELLGAYLIGSLAHGGFSRRYSDIDMALVTEAGLSPQALDRVRSQAAALSPDWGGKLSVFWTDRHFSLGRFPPLDRIDYVDHAVVLAERERVRPVRPTLEEIQHYLGGAPFANWTDQARRFATSETLEPRSHKSYLRTLLYPGRFCYSWMTGRMGSNDDAVAFLGETCPTRLDLSLIGRALQCRQADADPDSLFAEG
jgi:hypothetical protein